jgi:hypothetical protein
VRDKLGLEPKYELTAIDRVIVKALGKHLDRKPISGSPSCDASLRVGLPANFLFVGKPRKVELMAAWCAAGHGIKQPAATTLVQPAE